MNGTPRLRSSFPQTPQPPRHSTSAQNSNSPVPERRRQQLPKLPQDGPENTPLVPLTVLDAPHQRFYMFAFYIGLWAYRMYDWARIVEEDSDNTESLWMFLKWAMLDGVFIYSLPALRIPWLEWSTPINTILFLVHAVVNGMLMFRVGIPFFSVLAALVKILYDREIAVQEISVDPRTVLHNSSLIMGRQIINVLPEGSAILNPDRLSFCLDDKRKSVHIPIRLNQTIPAEMQLFRIDLDTNENSTISVSKKELKHMRSIVAKAVKTQDELGPVDVSYEVKSTGLYRLIRVVDESKLEVQRRISDTLVVSCPKAEIRHSSADRCIGDLSDLTIEVTGTPPMKIVYSQIINHKDRSFHFQSIQPENLVSPLIGQSQAVTVISRGNEDVSWAAAQTVPVRLNESMIHAGKWLYSIDEVHDAIGNVVNFTDRGEDGEHLYPKGTHLEQALRVHERPKVSLADHDTQRPLRVPTGRKAELPVRYGAAFTTDHTIGWMFSPMESLTADGEHGSDHTYEEFTARTPHKRPLISRPGLYTLKNIRNANCEGEVNEPASFMLVNPPKPQLSITTENIFDKCAGNAIGLMVDLDLLGTPPFRVRYEIVHNGRSRKHYERTINGLRDQLELKPREAGHFEYRFTTIDDSVYAGEPLNSAELSLEQDVKPPASAFLRQSGDTVQACIDEPVNQDVLLLGEPPFTLEYELVHEGKRSKHKVKDIQTGDYRISTDSLRSGGEYSLALTAVQDSTGCKVFLNGEVKINVRRQRPKAGFGKIDNKRSTLTLEGRKVKLPLRLEGEAPWEVTYRNHESPDHVVKVTAPAANSNIEVASRGTFELLEVRDRSCPGTVDQPSAQFAVEWIARPELKIAEGAGLMQDGNKFVKREVCEGDVDSMELTLSGTPPYQLNWHQHLKPVHGSASTANKRIDVALALATIPMDTSKAGLYTYAFDELSDGAYDHEDGRFSPLTVHQTVNSKPSARFTKPGQSYKYCKNEESGDEVIAISLTGLPPFQLEIDVKHQSSARPETIKLANIENNSYNFRLPHSVLSLGTHHVSVRSVRDARGCSSKTEYGAATVQVQVFDVPTIYPLETRTDYCVGDRVAYTLSGLPPFEIHYTFNDKPSKAKTPDTSFRRMGDKPGTFIINGVADRASDCRAKVAIAKEIHAMPSVKLSKGQEARIDIHEGGEAELIFEFTGAPPFEFTYTRSANARKGKKGAVLETRHDVSYGFEKRVTASLEGTYEVVAIKDRFCAFSTLREAKGQKLLTN